MEKDTYNGWTNYATWRINLEIFDVYDEPLDADACKELAEEIIFSGSKEETPCLMEDYAMAFLSDVNWHEIAEATQTE